MGVPLPVGAGPRRFFGCTVCFAIESVVPRKQAEGKGAIFRPGSNPSHKGHESK